METPDMPVEWGAISRAEWAKRFILAGRAIFTLRSQETGIRYTYRVDKKQGKSFYFVGLLIGPENESDYRYIGIIVDEGKFLVTGNSKLPRASGPVLAIDFVMRHLVRGEMPPKVEIWHAGRCGRCNRLLTVPESLVIGLGPECAGRLL